MPTSRRRASEVRLRHISLFSPEYDEDADLESIRDFLQYHFPSVEISVEPSILSGLGRKRAERLAREMARIRVKDPSRLDQPIEPMFGEVDFETRAAAGEAKVGGIVYDGRKFEDIVASQNRSLVSSDHAGIVFTQRLVSTFSREDMRHHLRTVICGFPSIVSVPGVVEAPAKPREFYLLRQELEAGGAGELRLEELKSDFRARFVDYGDPRLNEVLKGLSLQAIVHHLTLEPFCERKDCRLYNAHWQEDLIASQLGGRGLCRRHRQILERLGKRPVLSW
jgi:hypothetical protein